MRLARLLSAALSFTVVSALAVPEPRASAQAPADADVEKRQTGGGFTRSCSSYSVYQNSMDGRWYLGGTCRNNAGGQTKSAIALDICLANIAGSLKWQLNGNFQASCRNIQGTGAWTLRADCRSGSSYYTTYADLDKGIYNANGFLRCF